MDQLAYASASEHSVLQNRLAAPVRPARGRTSQWSHQAERARALVRHSLRARLRGAGTSGTAGECDAVSLRAVPHASLSRIAGVLRPCSRSMNRQLRPILERDTEVVQAFWEDFGRRPPILVTRRWSPVGQSGPGSSE